MTKTTLKEFVPLRNQAVSYYLITILQYLSWVCGECNSFTQCQLLPQKSVTLFCLMTIMMVWDLVGICSRLYIALNF